MPSDGPLARALRGALAALAADGAIELRADPEAVVARLAEALAGAGVGAAPALDDRARLLALLRRAAADALAPGEWQEAISIHYREPSVEEARRQAALTRLRRDQGSITAEQAARYWATLADSLERPRDP